MHPVYSYFFPEHNWLTLAWFVRRFSAEASEALTETSTETVGQSSTFSIDYDVPARSQPEEDFVTLRELHDAALDMALNEDDYTDVMHTATQSTTPSSSTTQSRSASDMWRKPQFNVASAESLLTSFATMLEHLPFVTVPADITVAQLAATRPFFLLAILTVSSGSKAVQKHALYDEEFLKILGLKYVSAGERSLQLLQGLLIYCAW